MRSLKKRGPHVLNDLNDLLKLLTYFVLPFSLMDSPGGLTARSAAAKHFGAICEFKQPYRPKFHGDV